MIEVQHGQMCHPTDKHWYHARKCNIHGHHGFLFICNTYSRSLKNKIKNLAYKFRKACLNGTVIIKERRNE